MQDIMLQNQLKNINLTEQFKKAPIEAKQLNNIINVIMKSDILWYDEGYILDCSFVLNGIYRIILKPSSQQDIDNIKQLIYNHYKTVTGSTDSRVHAFVRKTCSRIKQLYITFRIVEATQMYCKFEFKYDKDLFEKIKQYISIQKILEV